jgi:hypothetical protein
LIPELRLWQQQAFGPEILKALSERPTKNI